MSPGEPRTSPLSTLACALAAALLTAGCAADNSPTPAPTEASTSDLDSDGVSAAQGDCDDIDRDISPNAQERCDGVDNDCDGHIDESDATDATTWHADSDQDGWGDPDNTLTACENPDRFVANGADCDDSRDDVRPDADELCDLADNDCDTQVDEGEPKDQKPYRPDSDGDGYGLASPLTYACAQPEGHVANSGAVDCDDNFSAAYPGAPELCDGRDNDCDGQTDEPVAQDAPTWYQDVDGDTWGDTETGQRLCQAPQGWVDRPGDCDEGDLHTNPDADEICDGKDNDCDGQADEAGATDALAWFADQDGDSFGGISASVVACVAPQGYVLDSTDCDDAAAAVNPAAEEICTSGASPPTDEDCDGAVDEGPAPGSVEWYPDGDGDGYGIDTPTLACQPPEGFVTDGGDCDDGDALINPAAAEICNDGIDNNCDGGPGACNLRALGASNLSHADVKIVGEQAGAFTGEDVAFAGDINADGFEDLIVGAWAYDDDVAGVDAGAAYIFYGPLWIKAGSDGLLRAQDADVKLVGEHAGDHAGTSVRSAGDVNGDGFADVIIGANQAGVSHALQGVAYLLYGPLAPGAWSLALADVRLIGERSGDYAGAFVAPAGDLNQDGFADVLVGAPGVDGGDGQDHGAAYLLYGPLPEGDLGLSAADVRLLGEKPGDAAGYGIGGGGDFNGDGVDDFMIGAPYNDEGGADEGKVYLYYQAPAPGTRAVVNAVADGELLGELLGRGGAGYCVASGGDLNADGIDDPLIGAPMTDPFSGQIDNGTAYAVMGPVLGSRRLQGPPDLYVDGAGSQDQAGITVNSAGDLDADGFDDVLVGAWRQAALTGRSGAVRVLFGPALGVEAGSATPLVLYGEAEGDRAGIAAAGGGDIDADGYGDIIIGALGNDQGGVDAGAVYVIFGLGQ